MTSRCECAQEEAPNAVEAVTHPEGEAESSHPTLDSEAPTVEPPCCMPQEVLDAQGQCMPSFQIACVPC